MSWIKTDLKRSYECNKDLLVQLRERRGWTQGDLARVSGYTERLICKAESGRSISPDTIDVLAEALSSPNAVVHPEDLINDPIALAETFVKSLYTLQVNIIDGVRHFLDEDIEFIIAGDPQEIPFAGTHRGIEALEAVFKLFFSLLEVPKGHDHEPWYTYLGTGNEVFLAGKTWIHPKGCPFDEPIDVTHHYRFRRGKLYYFNDVYDTQKGARVLKSCEQN